MIKNVVFKGSPEDRPFLAVTSSRFRFWTTAQPFDKMALCMAEAIFSCQNSYFTEHADSGFTLAHEQLHFDITELHARKLVKRIAEEVGSLKELEVKAQQIVDAMDRELKIMQDKYDSEVTPDTTRQIVWKKKIEESLEELKAFENKQIKIKVKA